MGPKKEKKNKELSDYNRKFREQLLSIKTKLEKLQSDFGCNSNFLLLVEDNVTEKINMRGRDSVSAGRVLCCGEGDVKNFFCEGKLAFEPSVMSFLQPGNIIQDDPQFLMDWAAAVKFGGQKVKQEGEQQDGSNNWSGANQGPMSNTMAPNMAVMANMLAQLQALAAIKQEPSEAGQNAFGDIMNINNIVKKEPVDDDCSVGNIDPSQFLAKDEGQSSSGISGLNPFLMSNKIDPELVKNAADARMRDYSVQELVKQAEGGVNYSCSFCDFKTFCSKRLSVHVRSLHGFGGKKLICKECKFTTVNKQIMSGHIMSEHRKDLIRCKEDKCNYYSFNADQFRIHAEEHKTNVPGTSLNFKCDFCNFKSSSRKGIGVHINRIHSTESPAMKMMQKRKNQRHEAKKQELQALIDQQRKNNLE